VLPAEYEQSLGFRGGVDEDRVTGLPASEEIGIVVVRPDGKLADDEHGELANVGRSRDCHGTGIHCTVLS
jgi:hypothetical protein